MILKIRQVATVVFATVLGAVILIMSGNVRQGVNDSVELCISSVVPSLFLFTIVANFAVNSGLCRVLGRPLHRFSTFSFNLSGEQFSVFLLSLISGYPVGATLISQLLKDGKITETKARTMLNFCISAGPAFILITVGEVALGHRSDGYRLLFAHTLSSLILCFCFGLGTRIFDKTCQNPTETAPVSVSESGVSENFVKSAIDASKAMLNVCTFVIAFGALGRLITTDIPFFSPFAVNLLRGLVEVTNGVNLFGRGRLSLIAFLLGFGGISVHFQVLSILSDAQCRYLPLLLSRIVHGCISAAMIALMEIISPRYIDTAATPSISVSQSGNPAAVLALMLLGVVLVVYSSQSRQHLTKFDTSCQNR